MKYLALILLSFIVIPSFAQTKLQVLEKKLLKGTFYYDKKEYYKAKLEFEEALRIDSNFAASYNYLGNMYMHSENYDSAKICYDKFIALMPNAYWGYYNRGNWYAHNDMFDSSLFYFNKTLSMNPDYQDCYSVRGLTYLKTGKYQLALDDFETSLKLNPLDINEFNNKGLTKFFLKDYEGALKDFNTVIELKPDYQYMYFTYNNMANVYLKLKRMDEACKYWELAISNGYKYKQEYKQYYDFDDPLELIKKYCSP